MRTAGRAIVDVLEAEGVGNVYGSTATAQHGVSQEVATERSFEPVTERTS